MCLMSTSRVPIIVIVLLSAGFLRSEKWCKKYSLKATETAWATRSCNRRCGYVKVDWSFGYKYAIGGCYNRLCLQFKEEQKTMRHNILSESDMLEVVKQLNTTSGDNKIKFTCEECTDLACNDRKKVVYKTTTSTTTTTSPTTPKTTSYTPTTMVTGDTKAAGDKSNTKTFFTIFGVAALAVVLILFVSCYFTAKEQRKKWDQKSKKNSESAKSDSPKNERRNQLLRCPTLQIQSKEKEPNGNDGLPGLVNPARPASARSVTTKAMEDEPES